MNMRDEVVEKIHAWVQEVESKLTSMGWATYIRIGRHDGKPMSWTEVWEAFASMYPGKWAVQFFPPSHELVDEVNYYHLYVLDEDPVNVSIKRR